MVVRIIFLSLFISIICMILLIILDIFTGDDK